MCDVGLVSLIDGNWKLDEEGIRKQLYELDNFLQQIDPFYFG
jgi:hypothetical protein